MLKIYNTLAREKQEFAPITPGKVRMYVCGMTVYDYCHLGHARMMVVFDVVQRWLRVSGYEVPAERDGLPRIFSYGSDGKPGGKGDAADLDNFMLRSRHR